MIDSGPLEPLLLCPASAGEAVNFLARSWRPQRPPFCCSSRPPPAALLTAANLQSPVLAGLANSSTREAGTRKRPGEEENVRKGRKFSPLFSFITITTGSEVSHPAASTRGFLVSGTRVIRAIFWSSRYLAAIFPQETKEAGISASKGPGFAVHTVQVTHRDTKKLSLDKVWILH